MSETGSPERAVSHGHGPVPCEAAPTDEGRRGAPIAAVALLAVVAPLLSLVHFMNGQAPWSSPVRFRGLPPGAEAGLAAEGKGRGAERARSAPLWDDVDGLVVFGGDVMQHARQRGEDFDRAYSLVAPVLSRADVAVVNLEFPVHPGRPVGPAFVSVVFNGEPAHLAALARAGVDVVSLANNHAFDQGLEGLFETVRQARAAGLRVLGLTTSHGGRPGAKPSGEAGEVDGGSGTKPSGGAGEIDGTREGKFEGTGHAGSRSSPTDACMPLLCRIGETTVGLLAATYDVNVPLPAKRDEEPLPYPRDFPLSILPLNEWGGELAAWGRERIAAGSAEARRQGASSVVAFLHWGREWDLAVLPGQSALAREGASLGLSAIVGSHAHVPGPALAASGPVAFGLGNFCSDFREFPTRVGGLLHLGFRQGRLVRWGILPLLVLPEDGDGNPLHAVCPLDETRRDELAAKAKSWGRHDLDDEWERAWKLGRALWKEALLPAPPRLPGRPARNP